CSRSNHAPPMPSTARPPLTWSRVVASLAVRPGLRNVLAETRSPNRSRDVTAATAVRVAQPSSFGSCQSPSSASRWSSSQILSKPARSAARQASRSCGQSVRWIQNAAPNFIALPHDLRGYRREMPVLPSLPPALRDAVLAWFDANGRIFAIRQARDPYAILVSEVMAQQTQIGRAQEYWTRWMATFPTIESLASASPAE